LLLLARLYSGATEITYVVVRKPFQPNKQLPLLKPESYDSVVRITEVIPEPPGYILWPLQTATVSVLEKFHSSGITTAEYRLVLGGMHLSNFVG
jgi:hypothetical protein